MKAMLAVALIAVGLTGCSQIPGTPYFIIYRPNPRLSEGPAGSVRPVISNQSSVISNGGTA